MQGSRLNTSYVVASDPTNAYKSVRNWLDKNDYGFRADRVMSSIELVADEDEYGDVGSRLFIEKED
jgi:hypothetical protein